MEFPFQMEEGRAENVPSRIAIVTPKSPDTILQAVVPSSPECESKVGDASSQPLSPGHSLDQEQEPEERTGPIPDFGSASTRSTATTRRGSVTTVAFGVRTRRRSSTVAPKGRRRRRSRVQLDQVRFRM